MFKDQSSSSGSGASTTTKGDEVGIVSRFLAPLCARDETARNIALAAARTTVEGWLGEMASPANQQSEVDNKSRRDEAPTKLGESSGARCDIIARSSSKSVPKKSSGDHHYHNHNHHHHHHHHRHHHHHQYYPNEEQQSRLYNPYKNPQYNSNTMDNFETDDIIIMPSRNNSLDSSCDKLKSSSSSFDCVDGRNSNEFTNNSIKSTTNTSATTTVTSTSTSIGSSFNTRQRHSGGEIMVDKLSRSISSDEGKGFRIDRNLRFKDIESKFSSSSESERKIFSCSSSEKLNDTYNNINRIGKIKGARPKQLENDDLDSDTRIYGKSPKFDDNMGNFGYFETTYGNYLSRSEHNQRTTTITIPPSTSSSTIATTIDQEFRSRKLSEVVNDDDTYLEDDPPPSTAGLLRKQYEGVVFNTLDGFESDCMAGSICDNDDLDNNYIQSTSPPSLSSSINNKYDLLINDYNNDYYYSRSIDDRKLNAGQIKRPLSQDESMSSSLKSGRVLLEEPEVTLGDVGRMLNLGNALDGPRQQTQPNKYLSLVTLHLPVILRLSVNCPFQNVRIKCAEILEMVKDRGLPVPQPAFDGPSAFVPNSTLPNLDSLDEKTHMLLMDAFLQNNRLDHVSRVMSSHPKYLEHFLRTQHFILRGDGPLPYDYRHLIAIMAAGRHQCSYIINLQKGEFLMQGGNSTWLQGLRSIPNKLQNLYEINKILAHRPWLLNKTHIEKLTKGADSWSLAEVVHAIVLLAHFHSLSSFVFSCGINEELDNTAGHYYKENIQDNSNIVQPAKDKLISSPKKIPNSGGKTDNNPSPPLSPSIVGEQEVGVETLMERMKRLSEKSESYQITQEELSKRFETVETQSAELAAAPQRSSFVLDSDIGLFIEDPTFIYQDFAKRGQLKDIPTFRVQDYSWDDHGYSLVNRLYNDVGNLLDDKFKTAYNLTYYTMGTHNKVDTSRFRRAIWNYIQCMFGIRHDDYDYNEVNQLLERSLKTFIKSAVCYPERVTKRDYDRVMREFKHSEKVHVNLMILEARMQAELLYALRAVMRYMT